MGLVQSIVDSTLGIVNKVESNSKKDKIVEKEFEKEKIQKPIDPPKYYTTLEARRQNVKDGPYTVEAIEESLRNDVIPTGYSLEQLRKVGFATNVRLFLERYEDRKKNKNNELTEHLEKLKYEMENFVNNDNISQRDRDIIKKYDLFDELSQSKYISKIKRFIKLAKEDKLSYDVLEDMTKTFSLKIDDYNDALEAERLKEDHRRLVDETVLTRDKKVLESVKRALRNDAHKNNDNQR